MTSVKVVHWHDPILTDILVRIDKVASSHDVQFCVVGATARNLVMHGVYGVAKSSATADIDFAVGVDSWDAYRVLQKALIDTRDFVADDPLKQHQLRFVAGGGYPLDLIPYGGVVDSNHQLAWPPERSLVMNLIGYQEAVDHALLVELPGVTVPVVSIPSFVMLKLFAWDDRWAETQRDARDVGDVMRHYPEIQRVQDWLYGEGIALLEKFDYDIDHASIALLGVEIGHLAHADTRTALEAMLADAHRRGRLASHLDAAEGLGGYRVSVEAALHAFEFGLRREEGSE